MTPKELISRFRLGNQTIVDKLDQIQSVVRVYNQAKPRIRELDQILLTHFGRLSGEFFDLLGGHYKADREASKMLEFLAHDVKDIKVKYLIFIEKHSGSMGDNSSRNFPKHFGDFSIEIIKHLNAIEDRLLPLLESLPPEDLDL